MNLSALTAVSPIDGRYRKGADPLRAVLSESGLIRERVRIANRVVNRLGPVVALDMTEEEGASLGQVIIGFLVAERLLDLDKLWLEIEEAALPETVRVELFGIAAESIRAHLSDILRAVGGETRVSTLCKLLEPGVRKIATAATKLIRSEVRNEAAVRRDRLALAEGRHGGGAPSAEYAAVEAMKLRLRQGERGTGVFPACAVSRIDRRIRR